jgi:hypothetical protein
MLYMETRKIALIIFLVALIFLSLGAIVYVARQKSAGNNLQTAKLAAPLPAANQGVTGAAGNNGLVAESGKPITEEQITAKIAEKQTAISRKTSAKQYTDDELMFLSSPRQTAISELKAGQ